MMIEEKEREALVERMRELPKVALHRHLSGSVRMSTLKYAYALNVLGDAGKASEVADETVLEHYCIVKQVKDLSECMDRFVHTQAIFQDYDIIERVAFEVVEDAALDNVRVFELRYSPQYLQVVAPERMTLAGVHEAVMKGIKRACEKYTNICVGVIGILDRHLPVEQVEQSAAFMFANKQDFVALDLANDEVHFDSLSFKHIFQEAKQKHGLNVTIHSGEVPDDRSPTWVKNAITELGATRIGHGIHVVRDAEITKFAADQGVVFEVCPTSNLLTNGVSSLAEHPIADMLNKHKLKVTISTDDPGLFHMDSLSMELVTAIEQCGLTEQQVVAAQQTAYDASFIPDAVKSKYWKK